MSTRTKKHRIYVGKDAHKFSAAHMTVFPDGTKERLHGHNFQVTVALDLSEIGFKSFLDFSVVKAALNAQCKEWDDRLILAAKCPYFKILSKTSQELEFTLCGKRYVIPQDELVMLDLEQGAYFGLDPVGAAIWQAMAAPTTVREVCEAMVDRFAGDADTVRAEVLGFVDQLRDAGLVEVR